MIAWIVKVRLAGTIGYICHKKRVKYVIGLLLCRLVLKLTKAALRNTDDIMFS